MNKPPNKLRALFLPRELGRTTCNKWRNRQHRKDKADKVEQHLGILKVHNHGRDTESRTLELDDKTKS